MDNNETVSMQLDYVLGDSNSPVPIVDAYFNYNQQIDLAVVNYQSETIGILLNNDIKS